MRLMLEHPSVGYLAMVGGALGLLLAPVMVIIKYMTGWAVIPEPGWVAGGQAALGGLLTFAPPTELWTWYGTIYTLALVLMTLGLAALWRRLGAGGVRPPAFGFWLVLVGLGLVIPSDAIHSWTWHQNGLTTPTPGTNPLANTAYAVHMMGMNLVMLGSIAIGVSARRRRTLAPWLAWAFLLIFPSALLASVTLLPTTPSGALWLFSGVMIACGWCLATGNARRLVSA